MSFIVTSILCLRRSCILLSCISGLTISLWILTTDTNIRISSSNGEGRICHSIMWSKLQKKKKRFKRLIYNGQLTLTKMRVKHYVVCEHTVDLLQRTKYYYRSVKKGNNRLFPVCTNRLRVFLTGGYTEQSALVWFVKLLNSKMSKFKQL